MTATAVYSHLNHSAVYLLLQHGNQLLQLHVECVLTRSSVAELKHELERVLQALADAAKGSSQKADKIGIAIYAEGSNRITSGRYEPFWEIMGRRFRDTIIGDVLLAAVPAMVGLAQGLDSKQAAITFGTTALAVLIWLCVEAGRRQKVLVYEDV
jgi:magnesium-transporting ATPase (P-type)